jgi:hypothetical protein
MRLRYDRAECTTLSLLTPGCVALNAMLRLTFAPMVGS